MVVVVVVGGWVLAVCQDDGSVMGDKGFEIVWSLSVIVHQNK